MDQVNHRFVPRVLAVRAAQTVLFTNSDPANHNVRASSRVASNEFNVFTGNEGSYQRVFAANPKQQPVRVGCDIHPWMCGWIYVFEHSHFAVTDARGEFRIPGVPPGEYRLHIVQPDPGHKERQKVVVEPGETSKVKAVAKQRTAAGS